MFLEEAYRVFREAFNRIGEAVPGSHLEFTCNELTSVYSVFREEQKEMTRLGD